MKETESKEYLQNLLQNEKEDTTIISKFISLFKDGIFSSSDAYPEIFAITYNNHHPFMSDEYKDKLTLDLVMQWMPYDEYREGSEEENNSIDQENFHCYQLHLYLYYDDETVRTLKMQAEWQHLSSSYKEREESDKRCFLEAVPALVDTFHDKGYKFLGYEIDFTDAQ